MLGPGGRGRTHGIDAVSMVSGTFGKAFGGGGAFLATDAVVDAGLLREVWQAVVEGSFNRVTVDGDTSTNDAAPATVRAST